MEYKILNACVLRSCRYHGLRNGESFLKSRFNSRIWITWKLAVFWNMNPEKCAQRGFTRNRSLPISPFRSRPNIWRWFYNSRRVGYARFKRILLVSNWFRAFLLELPKRYVEIFSSRRIEKTDINRLWNAWIRRRRKQLFDPRWSRYTTSSFFANSSVRGWRRVGAQERNSATPGSFG